MSNLINLDNLATHSDFDSIHQDELSALLSENNTGMLTLDSQGHLAVITPPPSRDNCVVRFFKGLFSADYREQQKQLDRLPLLTQNAAFSRHIMHKLVQLSHPTNQLSQHEIATHIGKASRLAVCVQNNGPLTLESLHAAVQVTAFSTTMSSAVQAGFHNSHGRAIPVMLEGRPMELGAFLDMEDVLCNSVTLETDICQQVILQVMQGVNMQTCNLLTETEQREIVGLLARPESLLLPEDRERMDVLMTRVSVNLTNHLSNFINDELQKGVSPLVLTRQVKELMREMQVSQNVNNELTDLKYLNLQAYVQDDPIDHMDISNRRNEPGYTALLAAVDSNPIKAARLEMLITSLNLSPEEQTLALSLHESLGSMFSANSSIINVRLNSSPVDDMTNVIQLVQGAQAKGISSDRLPQIYEAALFAGMLNGSFNGQLSRMAPEFIESCKLVMQQTDSAFLAGAKNAEHPVNILLTIATVMRDKIQPLLPSGTHGAPILQKDVDYNSSLISMTNIHVQLNMAVKQHLETNSAYILGPDRAGIENIMRKDLNIDIPASAKALPSKEVLEGYFQKAFAKYNEPLGNLIHIMMEGMKSDPVSLDTLHEVLFTITQKCITLVKSNDEVGAANEMEQMLLDTFAEMPQESRLNLYNALMKDNSVGQYYFFMMNAYMRCGEMLDDNPNSLMHEEDFTSRMGQAQMLERFMASLEKSLGLDQADEHGVTPCFQRLGNVPNEISEHVYSVVEHSLKKINITNTAHL